MGYPCTPQKPPSSALGAAWAAQQESLDKRHRKPAKTSFANLVQASLKQNVPSLSHYEIDCLEVDGKTLRQLVTETKARVLQGEKVAMGKRWRDHMRLKYNSKENMLSLLELPQGKGAVSDGLFKACKAVQTHPPNRSLLVSWCRAVDGEQTLTEVDTVALMRVMCTMEPAASKDQRDVLVEALAALVRGGAKERRPKECELMATRFDNITLQAHGFFKNPQGGKRPLRTHSPTSHSQPKQTRLTILYIALPRSRSKI